MRRSVRGEETVKRKEEELCLWIYENYRDRIYRYLKYKFPNVPQEDLRDILQNVWTDLVTDIQKLVPLDETERLRWLLAVAKIEACDWYRANHKVQLQSLEEVQEKEERNIWDHLISDPVQDLVIKRLDALEIVRSLTEPECQVLYSSCGETGQEHHKLSTNAERCRLYRIRKKLRELFEKGELDE